MIRCRFWIAAQMAVMTDRGVPMHRSSQVMAFNKYVGMGRMRSTAPQAIAQVTTTAQLSQCLERVLGCDREGQTCWSRCPLRRRGERPLGPRGL